MEKKPDELCKKKLTLRLSAEMWAYLRKVSFEQERSLNSIIMGCLEKYKNKRENKLQSSDTMVS